jgi:hypothetical protein
MKSIQSSQSVPRCPEPRSALPLGKILIYVMCIGLSLGSSVVAQGAAMYGLEWPGDGSVRRMLYWGNPFPIYNATYVFKVRPHRKDGTINYYTTFFWGNNGAFSWDNGQPNTYYGAHPYPIPAPSGPGQWEIATYSGDHVTGTEVGWDRWYTQAFRAWRESSSTTRHEFYWDLPDTTKVLSVTINDPTWADQNPPNPAIVMGQAPNLNGASWGGYPGWEEFSGVIRGIQIYSGLLSVQDIQSEIATPLSTTAGQNLIWYLNLDPRPSDVTDKKGIRSPHNPSWDGTTALEWADFATAVEQMPVAVECDGTPLKADSYTSTRPRFVVRMPGVSEIDETTAEITIDGVRQSVTFHPGALSPALEIATGELTEGAHELRAQVFDAAHVTTGITTIRFFAASRLRIQSPRMFPNPASNIAHVEFTLTRPATYELLVFDVAGRVVYRGAPTAGVAAANEVRFSRGSVESRVASGVYIYLLRATYQGQQAVSKGRIVFLR